MSLRIVTRPLDGAEADRLCGELRELVSRMEGAGASLSFTPRGERRSIDLQLTVQDAAALSVLRSTLKADERIQMVF